MWDGSVTFGDSWAGYIGRADQNTAHSHVAIQLCIGVGQPATLELPGKVIRAAGVIIGPNVEHRAVAESHPVAFLYVSPDTALGRALNALLQDDGIALASDELLECFRRSTSLSHFVDALSRLLAITPPIDHRLYKALNILRLDRAALVASVAQPKRWGCPARACAASPPTRWVFPSPNGSSGTNWSAPPNPSPVGRRCRTPLPTAASPTRRIWLA